MKKEQILSILLVFSVLIIVGCSGAPNSGDNYNRKYYTGYDSLELRFMDESPPNKFYYDSESFDNEIPIILEVKNKGAADAYGAIYVHGYDPHIMQVAGGSRPGSSNVNFNSLGSGSFSFSIGGVYVGFRGGGSRTSSTSLGWRAPNGHSYGFNAFTQDGKVKGLDVRVNTNRIGGRLGAETLRMFSQYFGYNGIIALDGDTPTTPGGDLEVYEFPAYIYYLPESLEEFKQPIMITACYDYATKATALVCMDPKPNSNVKKACLPKPVSLSGGQGAPVSITRIEQQSSARKAVFTIYIKHTKKNTLDDLYDWESLYKCDPEAGQIVKATDKNVVTVGYIAISGRDITQNCIPDQRIRLDASGNGQITCSYEFDDASQTAYEAPIEVELWYGYAKNIYKQITIKKI